MAADEHRRHCRAVAARLARSGARRRRLDRVLGQGDHRQARLPARRRCGDADHVPHDLRAAAVPAAGLVGRAWQAGADAARLGRGQRPGLLGLLPRELPRLRRAGVHDGEPRAADPVPEPDAGAGPGRAAVRAARLGAAPRRAGGQLCRRAARLRPRTQLRRRADCARRGAGLRQRGELRDLPRLQRPGGQASGRAAPDRPGQQRGLRAVHRAVPAAAPAVGGAGRAGGRSGCRC